MQIYGYFTTIQKYFFEKFFLEVTLDENLCLGMMRR